jgi:hypothetical protein
MTWQSVTLETRAPHDLFLVAATTAVTGLEIAVQPKSPRIYANWIGANS